MTDWWASLKHSGLLLNPQEITQRSREVIEPLPPWTAQQLRSDLQKLADGPDDAAAATSLITTVLEKVCEFTPDATSRWQAGKDVPAGFSHRSVTGEMLKPRRVWSGPHDAFLPVFVDEEPRLGVGRGRRAVSRVLEWCRALGHPLALLTNGHQFRLIHVGTEHDAWAEWDTTLWFQGGEPGPQVEALRRLLAPANFTPTAAGQPAPLLDAIRKSRQGQSQLSGLLGERVRQAVEWLIHAHGPFLRQHPEFPLPDVYRAASLMVMRLVVTLFAESRSLFPRDNPLYEQGYGLNGLWEKLLRAAGGHPARLRHRFGAWPQVLALFRLIYHGSHHSQLPLRRYESGLTDGHQEIEGHGPISLYRRLREVVD